RAKTIDRYNKVRLIRALEIIDSIGKVPALNTKYETLNTKYDVLWLGLKPKNLEKRIKERLNKRLGQGMIKEVKKLLARGVSKKRLNDFGLEYRWVSKWLNQSVKNRAFDTFDIRRSLKFKNSEEYKNLLRDITKYSKRQMTWFKRNKEIHWIKSRGDTEKLISNFFQSHQEV
ncbi:MAG: hypothetical protein Q8Q90_00760, partial [bacterium]|nr:hypothetical protein [bacterium]